MSSRQSKTPEDCRSRHDLPKISNAVRTPNCNRIAKQWHHESRPSRILNRKCEWGFITYSRLNSTGDSEHPYRTPSLIFTSPTPLPVFLTVFCPLYRCINPSLFERNICTLKISINFSQLTLPNVFSISSNATKIFFTILFFFHNQSHASIAFLIPSFFLNPNWSFPNSISKNLVKFFSSRYLFKVVFKF